MNCQLRRCILQPAWHIVNVISNSNDVVTHNAMRWAAVPAPHSLPSSHTSQVQMFASLKSESCGSIEMIHDWSGTMKLFIDCVVFWNLLLYFGVVGLMGAICNVCVDCELWLWRVTFQVHCYYRESKCVVTSVCHWGLNAHLKWICGVIQWDIESS